MSPPTFSKFVWQEVVRCCTDIPVAQRLVILHIGATADPKGRNAWRANGLVVEELGVSPGTVKRARNVAIKHGLMAVTRAAPRGAGNTKTAEYQLTLPADVQAVDNPRNGGSTAPIYPPEIGSAEAGNRAKTTPEIGSAESHPSVTFGSFFGGTRTRGDSDAVEGGPDSFPGNSEPPPPTPDPADEPEPAPAATASQRAWVMGPHGPRCRSHVNDPDPPKCGGCRDARMAAEAEAETARKTRATNIKNAIDSCNDCDKYGRLDDLSDCPKHPNFRQVRVS